MKDIVVKEKRERRGDLPPINERIRATQLQVITDSGENVGIIPLATALRMAEEASLDLVVLSEGGADGVPIAKIMNFGKSLYEKKKKKAEAKKKQKVIQVKEIKLRPKIGEHDFLTKMRQSEDFLSDGKRVKITLSFRGRENISREERGGTLLDRIDKFFEDSDLNGRVFHEDDLRLGSVWSRVYFAKDK